MKVLTLLVPAVWTLLAALEHASAATVVWPVAQFAQLAADYYVVSSDVAGDAGGAAVWMYVEGDSTSHLLVAEYATAAVGLIFYETDLGEPVDADAVLASDPFAENLTGTMGSLDMAVDEIFYLGFCLSNTPGDEDSIYGWVALIYDGTTLTLVDSAAETSGVGIYAGTYTPIPEPTTACLALTGLAVLAVGRRWRRRQLNMGSS